MKLYFKTTKQTGGKSEKVKRKSLSLSLHIYVLICITILKERRRRLVLLQILRYGLAYNIFILKEDFPLKFVCLKCVRLYMIYTRIFFVRNSGMASVLKRFLRNWYFH